MIFLMSLILFVGIVSIKVSVQRDKRDVWISKVIRFIEGESDLQDIFSERKTLRNSRDRERQEAINKYYRDSYNHK